MNTITPHDISESRAQTRQHIAQVRALLEQVIANIDHRLEDHDKSKLVEPEVSGYASLHKAMDGVLYGSAEYLAVVAAHREVINLHYERNDHHPQHYANGMFGMSLMALLEMLCDWKARADAEESGLDRSFAIQAGRATTDGEHVLLGILRNTAIELGWL